MFCLHVALEVLEAPQRVEVEVHLPTASLVITALLTYGLVTKGEH
jgi:hypothetical protein